ncbi:Type II inositol 34-bisphosphate 4-phosphatase, partial [Dissostichus eleginoides]
MALEEHYCKAKGECFPVDHSSILNPTNTSGGAPGVAGTLDVTMGKQGEVLAQTLSFCLQGHSCLMVAPTASSGTDA